MSSLKSLLVAVSVAAFIGAPAFAHDDHAKMATKTETTTATADGAVKTTTTTKKQKSKKHIKKTTTTSAHTPVAQPPVRPTVEPTPGVGSLNIKDKKPFATPDNDESVSHTR